MMSVSPDAFGGHHASEPMTMGTPTSPTSPGYQSQYLSPYLLGDYMSHSVSPVSSRLWSGSGGSPPRSSHRSGFVTSPNTCTVQHGISTPRLETSMRGKDKAGVPPIRSLLQSTSPAHSANSSPFATPTQYPTRASGLSTPAPPITGLSQSLHETMFATPEYSGKCSSHIPSSPAQLDPFYTQGESLGYDDVLDETWITVFGFPPPAASYVLQQFSQYGNILKHVITTEGNWMHIHYQSKIQAKKALSKNGKILGNNIMVGVSHCIDKNVMEGEKENDPSNTSTAPFSTPNSQYVSTPSGQYVSTPSGHLKHTPIRPLTAAYMSARSENEVVACSQAPEKKTGVISKAMEYMFVNMTDWLY